MEKNWTIEKADQGYLAWKIVNNKAVVMLECVVTDGENRVDCKICKKDTGAEVSSFTVYSPGSFNPELAVKGERAYLHLNENNYLHINHRDEGIVLDYWEGDECDETTYIFDNELETIIAEVVESDPDTMCLGAQKMGMLTFMSFEPYLYHTAEKLSDYNGGQWETVSLSNGGFYMRPANTKTFAFANPMNYVKEDQMDADTFGIIICLYALSHFGPACDTCGELYENLYEFAEQHEDASTIMAALD